MQERAEGDDGPEPGAPEWEQGWWGGAQAVRSPNFGPRPAGPAGIVDLVVLHSISLPPGVYEGDAVERLFTNTLDCGAHPYYADLRGLQVSAHFFIRRSGDVLQFVSIDDRAWHAGASHWRGRDNCNDYSVGIELEGLEGDCFEARQYSALERLIRALAARYPLTDIAGHEHIAPERKHDPGPGFEWSQLKNVIRELSLRVPAATGDEGFSSP